MYIAKAPMDFRVALSLLFSVACFSTAWAGKMHDPGVANTNLPAQSFQTGIFYATNHSGLSIDYVSGETESDSYLASGPVHASFTNQAAFVSGNTSGSGTVWFSLDEPITIDKIVIWITGTNSLASFDLYSSEDANFTDTTFLGSFQVDLTDAAQVFDIADTETQYYRLDMIGVWGSRQGIGEVALVQAVPEPSTWALMALGMAFVACRVMRRKAA